MSKGPNLHVEDHNLMSHCECSMTGKEHAESTFTELQTMNLSARSTPLSAGGLPWCPYILKGVSTQRETSSDLAKTDHGLSIKFNRTWWKVTVKLFSTFSQIMKSLQMGAKVTRSWNGLKQQTFTCNNEQQANHICCIAVIVWLYWSNYCVKAVFEKSHWTDVNGPSLLWQI